MQWIYKSFLGPIFNSPGINSRDGLKVSTVNIPAGFYPPGVETIKSLEKQGRNKPGRKLFKLRTKRPRDGYAENIIGSTILWQVTLNRISTGVALYYSATRRNTKNHSSGVRDCLCLCASLTIYACGFICDQFCTGFLK